MFNFSSPVAAVRCLASGGPIAVITTNSPISKCYYSVAMKVSIIIQLCSQLCVCVCVCVCVCIGSLHRYAENCSQQLGETVQTGGVPVTVFCTQQQTALVFALHITVIVVRDSTSIFSCGLALKPIKDKINMNYNRIKRYSPYRAVNTLRLGYTNQSVNAV